MNRREIRREAKYRAGLMLMGNLNGWEPDDLIEKLGREVVDEIADEMADMARKLIQQGGGT